MLFIHADRKDPYVLTYRIKKLVLANFNFSLIVFRRCFDLEPFHQDHDRPRGDQISISNVLQKGSINYLTDDCWCALRIPDFKFSLWRRVVGSQLTIFIYNKHFFSWKRKKEDSFSQSFQINFLKFYWSVEQNRTEVVEAGTQTCILSQRSMHKNWKGNSFDALKNKW